MAPVAAGIAMAEKTKNTGAIVTVFHGDGAMAEGTVYETLNIAALWKLPLLFAIESNKYAQSTPIDLELSGSIARRAAAYDIPAREVDGNDVLMVHEAASQMIGAIRADEHVVVGFAGATAAKARARGNRADARLRRDRHGIRLHRKDETGDECEAHPPQRWLLHSPSLNYLACNFKR